MYNALSRLTGSELFFYAFLILYGSTNLLVSGEIRHWQSCCLAKNKPDVEIKLFEILQTFAVGCQGYGLRWVLQADFFPFLRKIANFFAQLLSWLMGFCEEVWQFMCQSYSPSLDVFSNVEYTAYSFELALSWTLTPQKSFPWTILLELHFTSPLTSLDGHPYF